MSLTIQEVAAELVRLKVPKSVALGRLARLTGIDIRTLRGKLESGLLGEAKKGPRDGTFLRRENAAAYFAGVGKDLWMAAFERRVPMISRDKPVEPLGEEQWRRPNPNDFLPEHRTQVGLLAVSSHGRFRTVVDRRGSPAGSYLKPRIGHGGYYSIALSLPPTDEERRIAKAAGVRPDYNQKNLSAHRLVASAFCDHVEGATEVNHKDGDRSNNRADNLEWVTRQENAELARAKGGVGRSWGRPASKLSPEAIADILTRQLSAKAYASKYDVTVRHIYKIWAGDQWKRMQAAE
jgi:hypothetical protein